MAKKAKSRTYGPKLVRELWARAAGRCEFSGCNQLLYRSSLTQDPVHSAEKAHIEAFSDLGARGQSGAVAGDVNSIENLMLVCRGCHTVIDGDKDGTKYSVELLRSWKTEHERRVEIVTGILPTKQSHVVFFRASIGAHPSVFEAAKAMEAMFPNTYPSSERAVELSMTSALNENESEYWAAEALNLTKTFGQKVRSLIEIGDPSHFSLFALAPMPLLIKLGALFTDKTSVDVYQLHREPQTWMWLEDDPSFDFIVHRSDRKNAVVALVLSLSASIDYSRITSVLGPDVDIWEVRAPVPGNDFLKSREQLAKFREVMRRVIEDISAIYGRSAPISIFPAVPVACAVELGRIRMPKSDSPWTIYDESNAHKRFVETLTLGEVS